MQNLFIIISPFSFKSHTASFHHPYCLNPTVSPCCLIYVACFLVYPAPDFLCSHIPLKDHMFFSLRLGLILQCFVFDNSLLKTFCSSLLQSDNTNLSLIVLVLFQFSNADYAESLQLQACQSKINFSAETLISLTAHTDENNWIMVNVLISVTLPCCFRSFNKSDGTFWTERDKLKGLKAVFISALWKLLQALPLKFSKDAFSHVPHSKRQDMTSNAHCRRHRVMFSVWLHSKLW